MYWDVTEVKAEKHLTLKVCFLDGTKGYVRFTPEHLKGVLMPLNDPQFFKQVFVDNGAVAWPGEIDLAPDAMYYQIKQRGEWVLQ